MFRNLPSLCQSRGRLSKTVVDQQNRLLLFLVSRGRSVESAIEGTSSLIKQGKLSYMDLAQLANTYSKESDPAVLKINAAVEKVKSATLDKA